MTRFTTLLLTLVLTLGAFAVRAEGWSPVSTAAA
ncbi:hypothetical protein C4K08_2833 [Pseudomonas chlororaphis subsp. aureofaciens]|nr:hypothetical protein C4K08_2833 [Pseudomonas chlororaphis subsp. aureofaciens]